VEENLSFAFNLSQVSGNREIKPKRINTTPEKKS
jgi:hypothetical protein